MLQLYLYTKMTRHMNEGTVMLLSLFTGKAHRGSCLYKATGTFYKQLFPKTACYASAPWGHPHQGSCEDDPVQLGQTFSSTVLFQQAQKAGTDLLQWALLLFQTIKLKPHHFPSLFNETSQMTLGHPLIPTVEERTYYKLMSKKVQNWNKTM